MRPAASNQGASVHGVRPAASTWPACHHGHLQQPRRCWAQSRRRLWAQRICAEAEAPASTLHKSGPNFKAVKDIEEIKKILPHRYPFLLVDRVLECEPGKHAVGYKNVTVNDQFFNGHFPERAIMPGVLQVEAMAQLGGIVMIDPDNEASKNNFFFGGVDGVKWRKPVVPGDTLMMRVEMLKFNPRFGIAKLKGTCHVGSDLVCEADMTLVMGK